MQERSQPLVVVDDKQMEIFSMRPDAHVKSADGRPRMAALRGARQKSLAYR
jgi:hypothetical protein